MSCSFLRGIQICNLFQHLKSCLLIFLMNLSWASSQFPTSPGDPERPLEGWGRWSPGGAGRIRQDCYPAGVHEFPRGFVLCHSVDIILFQDNSRSAPALRAADAVAGFKSGLGTVWEWATRAGVGSATIHDIVVEVAGSSGRGRV